MRLIRRKRETVEEPKIGCFSCRRMKSLDQFGWSEPLNRPARDCRSCTAQAKRIERERKRVPCTSCGTPRTPSKANGNVHVKDTGLCRRCFHESLSRAKSGAKT